MIPGLRLGLPTEEQWEYACRAGSAAARYGDLDQIAWYSENSGGETHPVALKQPNGWGLHDMLGNVWEWCADAYWEYGTGKSGASAHRVIRGGSWGVDAQARARGVPLPRRALATGTAPGLPLCRVQDSGTGRSERETGSGASGGARRSGCGAPRRPRHCERSGLDQSRRARNGRRVVRDADAGAREFGRRASRAPHDDAPQVGFSHRSRQVWALGGVHDRGERREAAHETRGQEEEALRRRFHSAPSASASAGSRRVGS